MLFKSKQAEPAAPPAVRGPLRQTLDAHLRKMESINAQRQELAQRSGALGDRITAAETSAKDIAARRAAIDARQVAAAAAGHEPPDLTAEHEALAHLERRQEILDERAAIAQKARAKLMAQSATLLAEYNQMRPALNHLLLDALLERLAELHPALMQAQTEFLQIHRQVFLLATAFDQHSAANRLGVFVGADRFAERFVPLPRCEPYEPARLNDLQRGQWEEQRRQQAAADYRALELEAQALIGEMLRG